MRCRPNNAIPRKICLRGSWYGFVRQPLPLSPPAFRPTLPVVASPSSESCGLIVSEIDRRCSILIRNIAVRTERVWREEETRSVRPCLLACHMRANREMCIAVRRPRFHESWQVMATRSVISESQAQAFSMVFVNNRRLSPRQSMLYPRFDRRRADLGPDFRAVVTAVTAPHDGQDLQFWSERSQSIPRCMKGTDRKLNLELAYSPHGELCSRRDDEICPHHPRHIQHGHSTPHTRAVRTGTCERSSRLNLVRSSRCDCEP